MREHPYGAALMVTLLGVASCSPKEHSGSAPPQPDPIATSAGPYVNILREDYVGPEVCGKCHQENYSRWKGHPHSRMNSLAEAPSVLGDFSGATLSYGDGRAVFRKQGN